MNNSNRSIFRAIRGPIVLIALGVLFTLHQFTSYSFWRLWPVLLILIGVLMLLDRVSGAPKQPDQHTPPGGTS